MPRPAKPARQQRGVGGDRLATRHGRAFRTARSRSARFVAPASPAATWRPPHPR